MENFNVNVLKVHRDNYVIKTAELTVPWHRVKMEGNVLSSLMVTLVPVPDYGVGKIVKSLILNHLEI